MAYSADILHRIAARLGLEATELQSYVDAMLEICVEAVDRGECVELMTFGVLCPTDDALMFRPHPSLLPLDRTPWDASASGTTTHATMSRDMLIDALAASRAVPRHSAQVFLHACFDVVKSLLREGRIISLPGIGRWTPIFDADGSLCAIDLRSSRDDALVMEVAMREPAALDARHFIPAIALQPHFPPARTPVDVAGIVTDLLHARGLDTIPVPDADEPPATELPEDASDTETLDVDGSETFDVDDSETFDVDDSETFDVDGSETFDVHDSETFDVDDTETIDAGDSDPASRKAEAMVDAEYLDGVSDPYLHDGSARTESQAEGDPLSDDAVFHRNRDQ
ncbi:MAG: hypothetical protein RBU27_03940, partial [Bacteroidota bacterium]|nr:hypothetical protein [Bacteroidota bacterium]